MMNGRSILCLLIVLAAVAAGFSTANAAWVQNGVALCTAYQHQLAPQILPDGAGGAIVVWHDSRVFYDIYAQRIDPYGTPLWTPDGAAIAAGSHSEYNPQIVSDGAGGAIIVWQDFRAINWDIYAQRVNADGTTLWTAGGVAVCAATGDQQNPRIVPDDAGGAVIVWEDLRSPATNWDVFGQRIDAAGVLLWTPDGEALCSATDEQRSPRLVADASGGAIVAWKDFRGGAWDIYAARVDASGGTPWTANGIAVCTAVNEQSNAKIASDALGGAVVVWADYRSGAWDIYAQRIAFNGGVQWTTNGVPVCSATGSQHNPEVASGASGEPVIVWQDARGGLEYDIYAQKLDLFGVAQWAANGEPVCTAVNNEWYPKPICDGTGGAIIAWQDRRYSGNDDIFAQKLDASGAAVWQSNGIPICTAIDWQRQIAIAPDGGGGAVMAWEDQRGEVYDDIYAQRIDRYGNWGYPAPAIESVRDVPGDQGGFVNLRWKASRLDPFPYEKISYYSIWRAILPASAAALLEAGAVEFSKETAHGLALASALDGAAPVARPVIRIERAAAGAFYWEFVSTAEADHLSSYSKTVPTLFDSTAVCDELHYFQVMAHAYAGGEQYWISASEGGYSVDNLAPCPPLALAGEQSYAPEGLALSWARNGEPDLDCYHVYRGTSADFVPGPGNMLGAPCDTAYFDGAWDWSAGYWYKVAAVDVHGNESAYAVLGPDGVTGEETPRVPEATYLAQNYPNPFNPVTRIEYGLAAPAHVALRIYDASGRLVRELVNGERPAGRYVELWDGRDGAGRQVASGIYFSRLGAGSFAETRKMLLLR